MITHLRDTFILGVQYVKIVAQRKQVLAPHGWLITLNVGHAQASNIVQFVHMHMNQITW